MGKASFSRETSRDSLFLTVQSKVRKSNVRLKNFFVSSILFDCVRQSNSIVRVCSITECSIRYPGSGGTAKKASTKRETQKKKKKKKARKLRRERGGVSSTGATRALPSSHAFYFRVCSLSFRFPHYLRVWNRLHISMP